MAADSTATSGRSSPGWTRSPSAPQRSWCGRRKARCPADKLSPHPRTRCPPAPGCPVLVRWSRRCSGSQRSNLRQGRCSPRMEACCTMIKNNERSHANKERSDKKRGAEDNYERSKAPADGTSRATRRGRHSSGQGLRLWDFQLINSLVFFSRFLPSRG